MERLDPFNGLLLSPSIDAVFDKGLISFDHQGEILISNAISSGNLECLGVTWNQKLAMTPERHLYMDYHRNHVFKLVGLGTP